MHGAHHASDELVDTIAFLHEWHKRGDTTFVVGRTVEVSEYEFLERFYLILEIHQVGNGLVAVQSMSMGQFKPTKVE